MKYAICTLGCKVNIFESESVGKQLDTLGFSRVDFSESADIYIINTCTVTNKSDSKSRKMIRQAIKRNHEAVVVVMGCYSQLKADEIAEIDGVDIILGNLEKENAGELILSYFNNNRQIVNVSDIMKTKKMSELSTTNFFDNTRAFLKIQDGCNNFCTFCIIPYARGLMRSKSKDKILAEIKDLIDKDYKEIVLTGIHTGGYGEEVGDYLIEDLVEDILKVEGLNRLRISSIEISQITNKLLNLMKTDEKLAKHLHIPIQSGSDEILELMKRKYTIGEYTKRISEIKIEIPNISVTTDLIVGFPTESDAHHQETVENCLKINFSEIHVFPYSKRTGTPAAKLQQVPDNLKKQRVSEMLEVSEKLHSKFCYDNIGLVDKIIIEKINDGYAYGKTSNYLNVKIKDSKYCVNDVVNIKVVDVDKSVCIGVENVL